MNSPSHPEVPKTLSRTGNSSERALRYRHPGALRELAYRAPHAPYVSQSRFALRELGAKVPRKTPDRNTPKQLRLRTFEYEDPAVKAAGTVSNRPICTTPEHVHKNQVPGRMWSYRVGPGTRSARLQRILGIVECSRQKVPPSEFRAQLPFESSVNDPLCEPTRANTARSIHHAIVIQLLVEPGDLSSAGAKRPRVEGIRSHEITPPRR
jgi:hypothetical protein